MSSGFGVLDQVTRDVWDKRSASPEVEQQSQLSLTTEGSLSYPEFISPSWHVCHGLSPRPRAMPQRRERPPRSPDPTRLSLAPC